VIRSLLLLTLLCWSTLSQAELTFEQLKDVTLTSDSLNGTFVQEKYLSSVDASLMSSGTFHYLRNQSIQWITLEPIQNELLMTPTSLVNKQGGEELMRLESTATPALTVISNLFFSVLTAEWQQLSDYFELSGTLQENSQQTQQWHATLTPIEPTIQQLVSKIELKGALLLQEVILHEPSGDRTQIRFENLIP
jgi:hypothetical protein